MWGNSRSDQMSSRSDNVYRRRSIGGPPRNGDTRVIVDSDNAQHLEFFMNGSWRHNQQRCREHTNRDCKRK
jgi:hypothetical protein